MRLVGAGVICYARNLEENEFYLLLGKEKYTPGWRLGSNRWSGFSGKAEHAEKLFSIAAREFCEESLGAVPLLQTQPDKFENVTDVEAVLRKSSLQLENIVRGKCDLCKHITFLTRVPFLNYPKRFAHDRRELLAMDAVFRAFHKCKKAYLESISKILLPGSSISSILSVRDVRILNSTEIEIELWCNTDSSKSYHIFILPQDHMDCFHDVCATWRTLVRYVHDNWKNPTLWHPAVTIQNVDGIITNAFINKAYLEKSELKWWSFSELRSIIDNKEKHQDCFRPYFLDFLHCILTTIENEGYK